MFTTTIIIILVVAGLVSWVTVLGVRLESAVTTIPIPDGVLAETPVEQKLPTNFLKALNVPTDGVPMNLLILGSDTREGQGKGFGSADEIVGARSDTTLLVHLSGDRTWSTVTSIPRDLTIPLPSCASNGQEGAVDRFNVAFQGGGPTCAVRAVTSLTGISVHHVVVVDFKGFEKIVDTLGGLPVCLRNSVDDVRAHLVLPRGKQTLSGSEALGLMRARYALGDGSDISRIGRQQRMLKQVISLVQRENLLTDPKKLYDLLDNVTNNLSTDEGLAHLPAMAALGWQVRNIGLENVEFATVPIRYNRDGATVSVRQGAAERLFTRILNDVPPKSLVDTVELVGKPSPKLLSTPVVADKKNVCVNPID